MKNKIIMLMLLTLCLCLLYGCNEKNNKELKELIIDFSKAKIEYILGEDLTTDNLSVKAKYSDDTTKDITDYTIDKSSFDKTKIGEYEIKISYTENEKSSNVSYMVKVIEDPNKVVLTEVIINESELKKDYIIGEELSLEGLNVKAKYSNDTEKEITNYSVNTSGYKKDKEGTYRILITYTEDEITKTAIYSVNVKSVLSSVNYLIGIDVMPRNVEFLLGTEFNSDTLIVMAIYQDGTKVDVTEKVTINSSKYNKDEIGVYEIVIDYFEVYGSGASEVKIEWDSFYFARVVNEVKGE